MTALLSVGCEGKRRGENRKAAGEKARLRGRREQNIHSEPWSKPGCTSHLIPRAVNIPLLHFGALAFCGNRLVRILRIVNIDLEGGELSWKGM